MIDIINNESKYQKKINEIESFTGRCMYQYVIKA